MQYLIEFIKDKNWQAILDHCKNLNDAQRYENIDFLKTLDIEKDILKESGEKLSGKKRDAYYDNRGKVGTCFFFAFIACTRNEADLAKTEKKVDEYYTQKPIDLLYGSNYEPIIAFYDLFPPDYLNNIVKKIAKDRWKRIDFKFLWKCFEKDWVTFDEAFFVRQLLTVWMFDRNTQHEADFLFENPEAISKVLLQFYKHETPILDISKWQAREEFVCKKVTEFWTEVFIILLEKGFVFDRIIIKNLLQSLQNAWKKPHLDWHVRLLDLFQATPQEYLAHQTLLFAVFGTGQPSLINFAIKNCKSISQLEGFDEQGFLDSFEQVFIYEKCLKSILVGLEIVETILAKPAFENIDYSQQLVLLLVQADAKLQEKTAQILVKHSTNLSDLVEPYQHNLKSKAREILAISSQVIDEITFFEAKTPRKSVQIPTNWNDLLFQIGRCIHSKSALDIDLFLEGLNQLQDQIPADFEKQLKPYTKQLLNRFWEVDTMYYLSVFIESWISKKPFKTEKRNDKHIPFLKNKCEALIQKLKAKNKLPFLSTPTHEPFYVHPKNLLERLLTYEARQQEIDLEDLIVACNRLMLDEIDENSIALAKQLKGSYSQAMHYFVGISDSITPTEALLPLWTQITRIKNPNGIFTAFESTPAKDYPSVVKPFWADFEIKVDANEYCTWYYLILENKWNKSWWFEDKDLIKYDFKYYNVAPFDSANRSDIAYQFSLNAQYLDALLCRYIPATTTSNEVKEFEDCLYPLQFLLENKSKIYHSGWLYIAACLIFEKKESRALAAEYIGFALERAENLDYLAESIGKLIAQKYAPINRLIEYFDSQNTSKAIKVFQLAIMNQCILHFDKEKLPTNAKKIVAYQKEWAEAFTIFHEK